MEEASGEEGGGGGERAVGDAEEVRAEISIIQFVCGNDRLTKVLTKKDFCWIATILGFSSKNKHLAVVNVPKCYLATGASSCFWEQGETQGN